MDWLLIVFMFAGGAEPSASTEVVGFASEKACEEAAAWINERVDQIAPAITEAYNAHSGSGAIPPVMSIRARCFPSGWDDASD